MRKFDKATLFAVFSVCASAALLLTTHTPAIGTTSSACDIQGYNHCSEYDISKCEIVQDSEDTDVYCVDCNGDGVKHWLGVTTFKMNCGGNECEVKVITYNEGCK